ncbi:uncharacterized protein B0H64DRAFT_370445 [Chaetomium fimeti]|uniref:Uncharacterized protein n=1 Tax=Chaetomium fimeti TaxID=1854472 RepID=A0AAE0LXH8_9PEZI|nr:hypothetical protein B0H64DRAFT_370445 [Chaetomium fimeti]
MSLQRAGPVAANLRTILVKVSPSPATLSERRAVLGALKRYAEVEVFKKLQDSSHFISIVAQPQMAHSLIAKSPLQFDVAAPQNHHTTPITTTPTSTPPSPQTKTFLVKIASKPDHNHKTHIREALTYGRWPEQGQAHAQALFLSDSLPRAALADTVPAGLARAGLADWESAGQLAAGGGDGEDGGVATWLVGGADFVAARRARRERVRSGFRELESTGSLPDIAEAYTQPAPRQIFTRRLLEALPRPLRSSVTMVVYANNPLLTQRQDVPYLSRGTRGSHNSLLSVYGLWSQLP